MAEVPGEIPDPRVQKGPERKETAMILGKFLFYLMRSIVFFMKKYNKVVLLLCCCGLISLVGYWYPPYEPEPPAEFGQYDDETQPAFFRRIHADAAGKNEQNFRYTLLVFSQPQSLRRTHNIVGPQRITMMKFDFAGNQSFASTPNDDRGQLFVAQKLSLSTTRLTEDTPCVIALIVFSTLHQARLLAQNTHVIFAQIAPPHQSAPTFMPDLAGLMRMKHES